MHAQCTMHSKHDFVHVFVHVNACTCTLSESNKTLQQSDCGSGSISWICLPLYLIIPWEYSGREQRVESGAEGGREREKGLNSPPVSFLRHGGSEWLNMAEVSLHLLQVPKRRLLLLVAAALWMWWLHTTATTAAAAAAWSARWLGFLLKDERRDYPIPLFVVGVH